RSLVGPPVIGANEVTSIAGFGTTDLCATVPATVQQRMDGPIVVADDDHGRLTQVTAHEVARFADLRLVGQEDPGAIEYPLDLKPVHVVAHEDIAAYEALLNIDPICARGGGPRRRRHALPL